MGQKGESGEAWDKVSEEKKEHFTTKTPRHKGISVADAEADEKEEAHHQVISKAPRKRRTKGIPRSAESEQTGGWRMELSDPGSKVAYAILRGKDGGDQFKRRIGFVECVDRLLFRRLGEKGKGETGSGTFNDAPDCCERGVDSVNMWTFPSAFLNI